MKDLRNKERIQSKELQDLYLKVFEKNEEPEYIQSLMVNLSESGCSGWCQNTIELNPGDTITGVIESESLRLKIRYKGKVVWSKPTYNGHEFGVSFLEDIVLPDVLIARLMAAA